MIDDAFQDILEFQKLFFGKFRTLENGLLDPDPQPLEVFDHFVPQPVIHDIIADDVKHASSPSLFSPPKGLQSCGCSRIALALRFMTKCFVTIQVHFSRIRITNLRNLRDLRNYKWLASRSSIPKISEILKSLKFTGWHSNLTIYSSLLFLLNFDLNSYNVSISGGSSQKVHIP
jgi:hypothetical protein